MDLSRIRRLTQEEKVFKHQDIEDLLRKERKGKFLTPNEKDQLKHYHENRRKRNQSQKPKKKRK